MQARTFDDKLRVHGGVCGSKPKPRNPPLHGLKRRRVQHEALQESARKQANSSTEGQRSGNAAWFFPWSFIEKEG